jgi:hypothetical protein
MLDENCTKNGFVQYGRCDTAVEAVGVALVLLPGLENRQEFAVLQLVDPRYSLIRRPGTSWNSVAYRRLDSA